MDVPDWPGAPDDDYPALVVSTEIPASLNAQKKAKRKRKQQAEQVQHILEAPVRLGNTQNAAQQRTKRQKIQDRQPASKQLLQAEPQVQTALPGRATAAPPAAAAADQRKSAQPKRGKPPQNSKHPDDQIPSKSSKHRQHQQPASRSAHPEAAAAPAAAGPQASAADDAGHELSQADLTELKALVQEASRHNPDATPSSPLGDPSVTPLAGHVSQSGKKPKPQKESKRLENAASKHDKLPALEAKGVKHDVSGFEPSSKGRKRAAVEQPATADSSEVVAKPLQASAAAAAEAHQAGAESSQTAAAAAAEAASAGAGGAGPQSADGIQRPLSSNQKKKLGRNARLRLKRQAFRQKQGNHQEEEEAEQDADAVADAVADATDPGFSSRLKKKASGAESGKNGKPAKGKQPKLENSTNDSERHSMMPEGQTLSLAGGKKKSKGLLEQMRSKLSGGRFRMLNEQLYTSQGEEAYALMQSQPKLFEQYHEGFRVQTQHWPVQPIDLAIAWLKKKDASWVAADFGCGDAQLASSVPQTVHSLDLVATAPGVIACNMAHTPLEDASVDAAIFCLALMGTDYGSFLEEASRVLRKGGFLWVAEVRSRFADTSQADEQNGKNDTVFAKFLTALKKLGLQVTKQDSSNKMFVVFVAQKVSVRKAGVAVQWPYLKPCIYKRR